jgi:hypothetical protein
MKPNNIKLKEFVKTTKNVLKEEGSKKVQFLADLVLKRGDQLVELKVVKFSPS